MEAMALSHPVNAGKSGRGLPQSKTLSRHATARGEFKAPKRAKKKARRLRVGD
jgi:hypothetical protein